MEVRETDVQDVLVLEPRVFGDDRGFFMEVWNARIFAEHGLPRTFVQDNHSRSQQYVLRGLHYQLEQAQGKLVRVVTGEVLDIAVDLRRSSPTFGKAHVELLSAKNKRQMWIPPGFAHGFFVLSDTADFLYKCTDFYAPEHERTLQWDDPALGIDWRIPDGVSPTVSEKDRAGTPLAQADTYP